MWSPNIAIFTQKPISMDATMNPAHGDPVRLTKEEISYDPVKA
jgi:hypothetical protein